MLVHDDHVHGTVIDFDEAERIIGAILGQAGPELFTGALAAMARCSGGANVNVLYASPDGTVVGSAQLVCVTARFDLSHEIGTTRTFPREVQILDGCLYDGFNLGIQQPATMRTAAMLGNECRGL